MKNHKSVEGLVVDKIDNVISIAVIGSYNTEFWIENRSDIDILVLLDKKISILNELEIEESILPILQKFFNYQNIHLTLLYCNEFSDEFAIEYIKSKNKKVFDELKEIDFRLYVNKYIRNNEWLSDLIKEDMSMLRRYQNDTIYKYKKERLEKKFSTAKDTLVLLQGAMNEYNKSNSIYLKRSILGYFQDFTEYIIDMSETYLVMSDNYVDGCSGLDLIKRGRIYNFFDDSLMEFL
ncbi:MAG: nucleotidyltransferase domain-containing protein [Clostridium sp.]|uniref:nucleotidyltransferase domain-containing protein n=1 Tax=Clostridium sp. TaxID=1506 RepID=UPI0029113505|nr:nucleotidyltransferase domain-containing protein [Clostridium sp.]MDU4939158.1 nucleotidyltransferase domain-containing protein [Clostridium sp.]